MKKLLLGTLIFLSFGANARVFFNQSPWLPYDGSITGELALSCTRFFTGGEVNQQHTVQAEDNCLAFVTTTSLPTVVIDNPDVTVESPETMSALINGDVDMANLVGLHFEVSGDKILETVAVMDEAGVEITLEDIGNNL